MNFLEELPVLQGLGLVVVPACVLYFANRTETWTRRILVVAPALSLVAVFLVAIAEAPLVTSPSDGFWRSFHLAFGLCVALIVPTSLVHRGSRWLLFFHIGTLLGAGMLWLLAGLALSNFPDGLPVVGASWHAAA